LKNGSPMSVIVIFCNIWVKILVDIDKVLASGEVAFYQEAA
jgi:hypothetical protein